MEKILESKTINIRVTDKGEFFVYDKIGDIEWNMGEDFVMAQLFLKDGDIIPLTNFNIKELFNTAILIYEDKEKDISIRINLRLIPPGDKFDIVINGRSKTPIEKLVFLKGAFSIEEGSGGFYLLPIELGKVFSPDGFAGSKEFSPGELSMFMYGIINDTSLLLPVWDDPSLSISLMRDNNALVASFITPKLPQRVQFRIIPEGEVESLIHEYREYIKRKGYILEWEEKLKGRREEIQQLLVSGVFDLQKIDDENLLSFMEHARRDLKIYHLGFSTLRYEKDEKKVIEKGKELGYPVFSSKGEISMYYMDTPLGEKKIERNNVILSATQLKEIFLPWVDIYMDISFDLSPSFYPLFKMVYGDIVEMQGKPTGPSSFDDYMLDLLFLGFFPWYPEWLLPEGNYWKKEENEDTREEYLSMFERIPFFMMGEGGWGEDMHPFDIFLKNMEEIILPFRELIFGKRIIRFEYLDDKGNVIFVEFENGVEIIVNKDLKDYECFSTLYGKTFLPPYGYIVSSDRFLSFHAYGINDHRENKPLLVSVRTLDGKIFKETTKLKVYHAFGPSTFKFMRKIIDVGGEKIYTIKT